MKACYTRIFLILPVLLLVYSCNNDDAKGPRTPITLGDTASIVTEGDTQYLKDMVTDIQPREPEPEVKPDTPAATQTPITTATEPAKEAAKPEAKPAVQAAPAANEKGLSIAFKEATVFIPNISVKPNKQDPQRGNGITYQLASGNLDGNQIKVSGGTVTKISQQVQTDVAAKNNLGTLWLDDLGTTGSWVALKGGNNVYSIAGLSPLQLPTARANQNTIRNAVNRSVKAARLSRKQQQNWINSMKNVRSTNQKPIVVILASVTWKIEGKDAKGKAFHKQVRIDVNP